MRCLLRFPRQPAPDTPLVLLRARARAPPPRASSPPAGTAYRGYRLSPSARSRPRGEGPEPPGSVPEGKTNTHTLQLNEEFWQYNTFQYWRNPLPPIDLADIEDVIEDNSTEAALQGKNEVVEIDMES